MTGDTIEWDLGELGVRQGRLTPGAIGLVEQFHGPIGGVFRHFAQGNPSLSEAVTIVFVTITAAEGDTAPSREDVETAVWSCGLTEITGPVGAALAAVMNGVQPAEIVQ